MNLVDSESTTSRSVLSAPERERILLEHIPHVHVIARSIHYRLPPQVLLEDLISSGMLGLLDAIHKFDRTKRAQFKSYASIRIRGAILDGLREMDWAPRKLRRQARCIDGVRRTLNVRLGRSAGEMEVAAELNMSLEALQRLLGKLHGLDLRSLQVESVERHADNEACRYFLGLAEADPFSRCLRTEMNSLIASVLDDFEEKERQVIILHYLKEFTMSEIGEVLGVGESRISQIHSAAIIRLRAKVGKLLRTRRNVRRNACSRFSC